VKVGDTVWLAAENDATGIAEGDSIVVTGAESGVLQVRRA
jgi:membrane protein implicated in regulation of membrane protease activity